jgi:hypothetical protein
MSDIGSEFADDCVAVVACIQIARRAIEGQPTTLVRLNRRWFDLCLL